MTTRWFDPIAAGLVALALLGLPGSSTEVSAKMKGAILARAPEPKMNALVAPPPTVVGGIDTQAKHALILEVETGAVLLDKFAEERIPPASMSKVMTAYLVFDYLKQGRAKLEDELPVSEQAWRTGGSKMFVPIGSRIKIDDLLRGMIIQSGNDACVVLAEGLAGSLANFIDQMNEKAKQIGLKDSHFANVDGLPDPDHYMTARDLATLAVRTIEDFPEYYHYYGEKDYNFNNINQGNRNPLLYRDIGADGLKTGHTDEAGYSLLASVKRDKRRVILVLNGLPSMKARGTESERLIEWAFREYNDYQLFAVGDKVDDAEVWLGAEPKVPMPIKKGDKVGKLVVTAPEMAPAEVPLVAASNVDRMGPVGRIAMVAAHLIWSRLH
jgi:D-alanyl-D-alanine carboxypeptidase (penicillin-binding protein 5/6)